MYSNTHALLNSHSWFLRALNFASNKPSAYNIEVTTSNGTSNFRLSFVALAITSLLLAICMITLIGKNCSSRPIDHNIHNSVKFIFCTKPTDSHPHLELSSYHPSNNSTCTFRGVSIGLPTRLDESVF